MVPVPNYGMDTVIFSGLGLTTVKRNYLAGIPDLVNAGGRCPGGCVLMTAGSVELTVAWQIQRAKLLLKMLNAPVGSLQHCAQLSLYSCGRPWVEAAWCDM